MLVTKCFVKMLDSTGKVLHKFTSLKRTKLFSVFLFVVFAIFTIRHPTFASADDDKEECDTVLDFVAVLDMSGSVQWKNWSGSVVPATRAFFENLDIGPDAVHTALVYYEFYPVEKWDFSYTDYYDKAACMAAFEKVAEEYEGGGTQTAAALQLAYDKILHGPGRREDVPALVLVITDGQSSDDVRDIAKKLHEEKVIVMVIGVAMASDVECRTIAGCAYDDENCPMYKRSDWSSLVDEVPAILKKACKTVPKKEKKVCPEWEAEWGPCSVSCGPGYKVKKRKSSTPSVSAATPPHKRSTSTPHGKHQPKINYLEEPEDNDSKEEEEISCDEEETMEELCNMGDCPQDSKCGDFGAWTCCTKTCGGGFKERERTPWNEPAAQNGGKTCEEQGLERTEKEECSKEPCPKDAVPGDWTEWNECSVTCGFGITRRHRNDDKSPAEHGGKSSKDQHVKFEEEKMCQIVPCGPCISPWADWTNCTRSCGAGYRSRHRVVEFDYPDHACPHTHYEKQDCKLTECAAGEVGVIPEEPTGGGGTNTAAIAGGVVGGAALLGAAAAGAQYYNSSGGEAAKAAPAESYETTDQEAEAPEDEEVVNVDADSELWT